MHIQRVRNGWISQKICMAQPNVPFEFGSSRASPCRKPKTITYLKRPWYTDTSFSANSCSLIFHLNSSQWKHLDSKNGIPSHRIDRLRCKITSKTCQSFNLMGSKMIEQWNGGTDYRDSHGWRSPSPVESQASFCQSSQAQTHSCRHLALRENLGDGGTEWQFANCIWASASFSFDLEISMSSGHKPFLSAWPLVPHSLLRNLALGTLPPDQWVNSSACNMGQLHLFGSLRKFPTKVAPSLLSIQHSTSISG